jgi:hypothetical protein
MEATMRRGVLLAGLAALAVAAPAISHALGPVEQGLGPDAAATPAPPARQPQVLPAPPMPPAAHAEIPPLPPGGTGYVWDSPSHRYVPRGDAIWVPGHWQTGDAGQAWVDGRWMYPGAGSRP